MTFMFEGSLLRAYLEKIGIKYELKRNKKAELCFRKQANELINIKTIPSLEKLSLCHSGQAQGLKIIKYQKSFNNGLRNLRQRKLANIPNGDILITTRKDIWFKNGDKELNKAGPCAKSSRLFNANWIANTTRGTNDYSHCSTLLYIYDQHVNPTIAR